MTATMILFHGDDQLEFADGNGKSLGMVGHPRAGQIFQNITSQPSKERAAMIRDFHVQLTDKRRDMADGHVGETENETPAGNSAGFERTTGEDK